MKVLDDILLERRRLETLHPPVPTGFTVLDGQTTLLRRGMVTLMAGRPGMGCTTFAAQTALKVAKRGEKVLFFCLDSPLPWVIKRLEETEGGPLPAGLPLYFDDRTANLAKVLAEIKTSDGSPVLAVVDTVRHLYRVSRRGNLLPASGPACRELKRLAEARGMAVLALSPVLRAGADRFSLTDLPGWDSMSPWVDTACFLRRWNYCGFLELGAEEDDTLEFFFLRHTGLEPSAVLAWDQGDFAADRLP